MGKLKRSAQLKNNRKKKGATGKKAAKVCIEELLESAEQCMDECDLESAYKYVKSALDVDDKHVRALETMASVQMEMGNVESARGIYVKLVELSPAHGFSKYMCLAQLSSGMEAVQFYEKGVSIMLDEYSKQEALVASMATKATCSKRAKDLVAPLDNHSENGADCTDGIVTRLDISTAYGSIAEIYLTDLCMEENAESLCKTYLDKSLEYEADNAETLQLLASYWLSKDEADKARTAILQSVDAWLPKYVEACEAGPLVDPAQAITLTYDARINTSRILTELNEYDKAIVILEQLLDEDDEVVVVWYMIGWVNHLKGDDYKSNAKYYLKKAEQLAEKIKYEQRFLDDQLRSHIKELLDQLVDVPFEDDDGDEDGGDQDVAENGDGEEFETDSDEEDDDNQMDDACTKKKADINNNDSVTSKSKSQSSNAKHGKHAKATSQNGVHAPDEEEMDMV